MPRSESRRRKLRLERSTETTVPSYSRTAAELAAAGDGDGALAIAAGAATAAEATRAVRMAMRFMGVPSFGLYATAVTVAIGGPRNGKPKVKSGENLGRRD